MVHRGELVIRGTAPSDLLFDWHLPKRGFSAEELGETLAPKETVPDFAEQARSALVHSGFRSREARSLVDAARAHVGSASLKELIHEALRRAPAPKG